MAGSVPFYAFVGLIAAAGVLRLYELALSARRLRGRSEALVVERWLFPSMVLLHVGLLSLPVVEVLALRRPFLPWLALISSVTLLSATLLRVWAMRTLRAAWNVRIVRPDETQIVVVGPYALIRHPNYLAVILEVAAIPLFHSAWLSAAGLSALNAFVLYHRIRREEQVLRSIPAWREAMQDRPRFFPRVF